MPRTKRHIMDFGAVGPGIYSLVVFVSSLILGIDASSADCQYHALGGSDSLEGKAIIQSPNYPFQYPKDTCIVWFYTGISGSNFFLRILDLDLPGDMGSCSLSSDSLVIGLAEEKLLCGSLAKTFHPEYHLKLTRYHKTVYISFNSTSNPQKGTGFRAEYYTRPPLFQLSKFPAELDGKVKHTTEKPWSKPNQDCHWILTNTFTGLIPQTTLNGRTVYQCNGLMTWLVLAPMPKIHFTHAMATFLLDINRCPQSLMSSKDVIEVFDGNNVSMPLILRCGKYGRVITGSQSTHTNSFFVRYYFDPSSQQLYNRLRFKLHVKCIEGFVSCGNENACYDPSARCNGSWECPMQGRDELNCGSTFCPGKYSCDMNSNQCYEEKDRCNGKGSCTNYKDEMNCDSSKCNQEKGLFLCSNSRCIYEKWRCDGSSDCADNSDENGCGVLMTPRVIVAAVVGSLLCSLLMVVAMGCVCKVYRLRQIQLLAGSGGSCCHAHGRHDSPLTRQLAEMFRQRAPPPPYHEAMLTSRPYHEILLESTNENTAGILPRDSRREYTDSRGRPARDCARTARPLRRRGSDSSSSGIIHASQHQDSRRPRGRRQHDQVHHQNTSLHTTGRNTGFIEVGSLTFLCSGQQESREELLPTSINPPPYSLTDPATATNLEFRQEAVDSFTGNDQDNDEATDERQQRKARSRTNQETGRRAAEMPCLEMSQVTSWRDQRPQTNNGQTVHSTSQNFLQRDGYEENYDSCKREDETQASLSLSWATGLDSPQCFERESTSGEDVVSSEKEESDSECILLGEEDDKVGVKDDMENEDIISKEDFDESDTTCLLSSV